MMKKEDLLKYSFQIIAYLSKKEYNIANGFLVMIDNIVCLVTAAHSVVDDDISTSKPLDKVYLMLHVDGNEFKTKVLELKNWQFFDLIAVPKEQLSYNLSDYMEIAKKEDLAYCIIESNKIKDMVAELSFKLKGAEPNTCHSRKVSYIDICNNLTMPESNKKYYMAGRILKEASRLLIKEYEEYFYREMEFIGMDDDGYYKFRLSEQVSIDCMAGLSGTPIFDNDKKFVGMAVRFVPNENIVRAFPAETILYYLNNG